MKMQNFHQMYLIQISIKSKRSITFISLSSASTIKQTMQFAQISRKQHLQYVVDIDVDKPSSSLIEKLKRKTILMDSP